MNTHVDTIRQSASPGRDVRLMSEAVPIADAATCLGVGINRLRRLWREGKVPRIDQQFTGRRQCIPRWWIVDAGRAMTLGAETTRKLS